MTDNDFTIVNGVLLKYNGNDKKIVIPENVIKIDYKAFYNNENIASVEIPANVISIEDSAFEGCLELKKITFHEGIQHINSRCFYQCEKLISVVLPKSLIYIGDGAFAYCKKLRSVIVKNNSCKIGKSLFYECTALKELVLPQKAKLKTLAFGSRGIIPKGLLPSLPELYKHLSDGDLLDTVSFYWPEKIDAEMLAMIFINRLKNKPIPLRIDRRAYYEFFSFVSWHKPAVDQIAKAMLEKLPQKANANICLSVACALLILEKSGRGDYTLIRRIYNWLGTQENNQSAFEFLKQAAMY